MHVNSPREVASPPQGGDVIRIGVLGAASILNLALVDPASRIDGVEIAAIASRDRDRAAAVAAEQRIARVHDSYEALLADDSIDAVYIPLPSSLHADWMIAAVEAGKHVLCEKPFTGNAAAAQRVLECTGSSGKVVMEAYHTAHHPLFDDVHSILASGELGALESIRSSLTIPVPRDRPLLRSYELGGGALLDVGYYPLRIVRDLFGKIENVHATHADIFGQIDEHVAVDATVGGVPVSIEWSIEPDATPSAELTVIGDRGWLEVSSPSHPQYGHGIDVTSECGKRTIPPDARGSYDFQLEHFRDAIQSATRSITDACAAVAQMTAIDYLYASIGLAPRP
jgi:predicted dehydrogenase